MSSRRKSADLKLIKGRLRHGFNTQDLFLSSNTPLFGFTVRDIRTNAAVI